MERSIQQLQWLLSGIDFIQQKIPEKCQQPDEADAVLMDQLKQMLRHRFGQTSEGYIDPDNPKLSLYGEVILDAALDEDEDSEDSGNNEFERLRKRRAKKSNNTFAAHP
jgi:transposase